MHRFSSAWPAFACAALGLAGCRVSQQDNASIGAAFALPALNDGIGEESIPENRVIAARPEPVPLNREVWKPTRFEVPADHPPHGETFTTARWNRDSARASGDYPTPLTALDPAHRNRAAQTDDMWLSAQEFVHDVIRVPEWTVGLFTRDGLPRGGFSRYARARSGPWLGEVVGASMQGDPLAPEPAPGSRVGEPGVIRRIEPVGDRPETPKTPESEPKP